MLKGKHIILGISGGIAAYKSVSLLRLLVKAGAEVQVVITPNGKEFITPVTLSALSGKPVICDFFTANTGTWNSHVDLGLWADLMVIAPATASTLAKMAHGVADNMLITTYLSAKCQVMIAPAMDLDMYRHPSTKQNLEHLQQYGNIILEVESGELASHLVGKGRMAEPETIFNRIEGFFTSSNQLAGKRILITAGPTYERIDPVRFIGNYSSGKMGYSLADECARRGAEVVLVSGPVSVSTNSPKVKVLKVESAKEMLEQCLLNFSICDIAIMCAAVADYHVKNICDHKIKRENDEIPQILLEKNPDIAATLGKIKNQNQITVGFALETNNELSNAKTKLQRKNLDMIVLNSLNDKNSGFGTDNNTVTIIQSNGEMLHYDNKPKTEVAKDIVDTIINNYL